ncbi:hypothetical protein [Oceanidesulfovibrio marinus]|uniref:Uncharacterized protein n=1 Tax=Oceanidesulfovibrio marinus TaxID=370038 RepID=A0A6P1ZD49_9BACT|nr:hypothetical protein [Oceanidesulfovibrio marinus]TVM31176.1 hypothetical protein DQK91_18880 [Oceanidesulfovibrio marinus]
MKTPSVIYDPVRKKASTSRVVALALMMIPLLHLLVWGGFVLMTRTWVELDLTGEITAGVSGLVGMGIREYVSSRTQHNQPGETP